MKKIRKRGYNNSDDATSDLLLTDPELKKLGRRLHRQENRLKTAIGSEVYKLYLDIEETYNQRSLALARRIWATALAFGRSEARKARKGRASKQD